MTAAAERAGLTLAAYIIRATMDAAEPQDGPITEVQQADREKPGSPAGFRRRTPLARKRPSSLARSANSPGYGATGEQSKRKHHRSPPGTDFCWYLGQAQRSQAPLAAVLGLAPLHTLAVALCVTIALTTHSYGLMYGRTSGPSGPIRGEIGTDLHGCMDHFACGSGPEVVPSRGQLVPSHRVSGRAGTERALYGITGTQCPGTRSGLRIPALRPFTGGMRSQNFPRSEVVYTILGPLGPLVRR